MTKERREEVLLVAVVLSVAIHAGLMVFFRPQVMTHIVQESVRAKRVPVSVVREADVPPPAAVAEMFEDLEAAKDAPEAETVIPVGEAVEDATPEVAPEAPSAGSIDLSATPALPGAPVFEVAQMKADKSVEAIPIFRIETPSVEKDDSAPAFRVSVPASPVVAKDVAPAVALATPSGGIDEAALAIRPAAKIAPPAAPQVPEFVPAETVYEKVDEKAVEAEKAAVKMLVASENAAELSKFVNIAVAAETSGGWTYFRVMLSPRKNLQIVPKDLVVLVDASGSIGKDRMASIRNATKKILRSAMNSGDRFNLVAFRDRYAYAFKSWQECDQQSFDEADRWIGRLAAHGRTDVFATIRSVLTLPRVPERPLIALVVTDGDANEGVSDTAEILSKFTALNDGLVSVYMYGVKSSANRELIDVLTRGNRGESRIYDGWRKLAGNEIESFVERFRDPVLTDLRIVFASDVRAEAYPRILRNIYSGDTLSFVGRVPEGTEKLSFSLRGLNGANAYEGFFDLPLMTAAKDGSVAFDWNAEQAIDSKLGR